MKATRQIKFGIDWQQISKKDTSTRKESPSFLKNLQKQAMIVNNKIKAFEIMNEGMDKFSGTPEHEMLSQRIAILDMQLSHTKNALIF